MDKELIIIWVCLILLGVAFYIGMTSPFRNNYELRFCNHATSMSMEVIYEDNLIYDKCIIIEDGEELTRKQWLKKHRYDGLEVRE